MKKILVSIILFVLVISLTGCKDKKNDEDLLKEKVTEEIKVMESRLLDMLNNCNNISTRNYKVITEEVENKKTEADKSQSEKTEENSEGNNSENSSEGSDSEVQKNVTDRVLNGNRDTNWNEIKNSIEILNDIWSTVIDDLYKFDVNKEDILKFSNSLNMSIISIKNSDKANTMQNLLDMYSRIAIFANNVFKEEYLKNEINAKYHIVSAYTKIETERWDDINSELVEAEKYVNNNMNNIKKENGNIEKVYISLKEFQNSINNHDKDVLYIKYKALIEEYK